VYLSHAARITNCERFSGFLSGRLFYLSRIRYHVVLMRLWVVVPVRILEGMFVVGSIGSVAVLVISGIEDLKTLFGMEEDESHL
jgi:hypothetical protein